MKKLTSLTNSHYAGFDSGSKSTRPASFLLYSVMNVQSISDQNKNLAFFVGIWFLFFFFLFNVIHNLNKEKDTNKKYQWENRDVR